MQIIRTQIKMIINNTAPPAPPATIGTGNPLELSSLLDAMHDVVKYCSVSYYLLIATQANSPPTLLHFTEVPSSFTSSHTCSPLPLTL